MDKNIRRFRQGLLDVISTWGIALVVIVVGFVVTYQFVEPAPPTRIVLATGQDGGAYHYYGEQFAAYLAGQGIETELLETAGAVENLERLESGAGVNLAFVQGGLAEIATVENVVAIGSLYWEPLWLFGRADVEISAVDDLVGKRVAIGREGSGTRAVTLNLLLAHGINAQNTEFLDVSSDVLAAKFAQQSVDAAFLIGAPASGDIAELISRPDVKLLSLQRASAYVRRYPYFSRISLPQGAIDLQFNVPATDIDTVALTKLDVLDGLEEIKICVGYRIDGEETDRVPASLSALEQAQPVYRTVPGWQEDTVGLVDFEQLPEKAREYVRILEQEMGVPIGLVSTGPRREETILRSEPRIHELTSSKLEIAAG